VTRIIMNEESDKALEVIRRSGPNLPFAEVENIYERGMLEYLTKFAIDGSNAEELRQTIRNTAIDQLGLGRFNAR